MDFGSKCRSEVDRIKKDMQQVGVPSGCHGEYEGARPKKKILKDKWLSEEGFVTGIRTKFFKNSSAWKVPPV